MAREMITAFVAVDTPVMTDRQKVFLHLVSFEWRARMACAIMGVDRNVQSRDDGRRLHAAKNWKSELAWEAAYRLDPQFTDE
eukprot:2592304-Pyramimonas_sp.AAC.1